MGIYNAGSKTLETDGGKEQSRYYLAYGSNLNVSQMKFRCPGASVLGTAELKYWELLFRGSLTGAYLTIRPSVGGTVPVAVWRVTPEDERKLDRYEGYPDFYYKKELQVRCKESMTGKERLVTAFVYIMREYRPFGLPSEAYMQICREGYEAFGFDQRILDEAHATTYAMCHEMPLKKYWIGEERNHG